MKNTNRYIALALCFTPTLGAFAYRPSEAKAIAGVDDAVVIGALLSAFAGGCGLIFSNNGMTSGELAQGLTDKWNEFNEAAESGASSFAAWLGFEDTSALLGALSFSGGKLTIPRAIAQKFAEFTTWLVDNLGLTVGGDSVPLSGNDLFDLSNLSWDVISNYHNSYFDCSFNSNSFVARAKSDSLSTSTFQTMAHSSVVTVPVAGDYTFRFRGTEKHSFKNGVNSSPNLGFTYCQIIGLNGMGNRNFVNLETLSSFDKEFTFFVPANSSFKIELRFIGCPALSSQNFSWKFSAASANPAARLSVFAPSYYKNPTIDLPADGETANSTLSGVGDGMATSIEGLLQQILAQLQANTLAPTLEVAGTETGGNTGADEDAKPYLPYIPQIFEKIKELSGTLANIWESIKGIPAAIAEKIGAFFTTLWGWLQNIIDAITALPAAIAEKIKALFVPREGYAAEFVADITATYQGRMGLLTYPFTVLADFVGTVATLEEQEPVLRWDAVEWQNKTIIAAGEYNLKSAVSSAQMQTVYMIYKTVVSGMLVVAFLHLCYKKLKEVQRN